VANIGNLDLIVRNNAVDDPIGVPGGQKRTVAGKGAEHGWTHFGEITQKFKLAYNLILNTDGKGRSLFLSSRE
jgi:hypothetical protein